jgi:hypothetical protein
MANGFDESLEERLNMAEQAEMAVRQLQSLASEAPTLRAERAKTQRAAERQMARDTAMGQAADAMKVATERQSRVPELLGTAARAIGELFTALKDIENRRQAAMQALAVADRVDYEIELEEGEEREHSLGRDPRGLAYAIASRHGDARVIRLLEELSPGFALLYGCNTDDPLYRDVAKFVVSRVTSATPPMAAAANQSRPSRVPELTPTTSTEPGAKATPPIATGPAEE